MARTVRSADMNVYTVLLVVSALVLLVGVAVLASANLKQVEGTANSGNRIGLAS
jgi:hypothetical protein